MTLILNFCSHIYTYWVLYADTDDRAMPTLEGTSSQLDGDYTQRVDAVRKCARLAASRSVPEHQIHVSFHMYEYFVWFAMHESRTIDEKVKNV